MTFFEFCTFFWNLIDQLLSLGFTIFGVHITLWNLFFAGLFIDLVVVLLFHKTQE